jgi:hypothetical protein
MMRNSYEPCLCGAPDCPQCFPGNFTRIGGRLVYNEDEDKVCEVCNGTGRAPCPTCQYTTAEDGCGAPDYPFDCPVCPECDGKPTARERAEAAEEDEAERRAEARRDRDWRD